MRKYESSEIRNIALLGHSGSGKSRLCQAILYNAGKGGKLNMENVPSITSDINLFSVEWKDHKYNFIDTPGYLDFYGEAMAGVSVSSGAVVIVDGTSEIEAGTDRALELTDKYNIPKIIFVNKIDSEKADYYKILSQLRERYGKKIAPFHVPIGSEEEFKGYVNVVEDFAREYNPTEGRCYTVEVPADMGEEISSVKEMLMESVAETDESLLEKYFSGESFSRDEVHMGLRNAVISGEVIPVLCGASLKNIGVHTLMWLAKDYFPSPVENGSSVSDVFSGHVFKTYSDKFQEKISLVKIESGELSKGSEFYNARTGDKEKCGSVMTYAQDVLSDIEGAREGDIVALVKCDSLKTGDTISSDKNAQPVSKLEFPKAQLFAAIEPKSQFDEDKISEGLRRLSEENPSLSWERSSETGQLVLGVQGEMHLDSVVKKLSEQFGISVSRKKLEIPYKETISGSADIHYKHKKQSGGHGQYGDVKMIFGPSDKQFEFEAEITGGAVPKQYIPSVEQGVIDSMGNGVLGGYPVINIKAKLYDGSYHNVDSSEMAFRLAANQAFKEALKEAGAKLLEPVMSVKLYVPEDSTGDVMGDVSKKRGQVLGIEPIEDSKLQLILAEIPQSEAVEYSIDLRTLTNGRGHLEMSHLRYQEVPEKMAEEIISAKK